MREIEEDMYTNLWPPHMNKSVYMHTLTEPHHFVMSPSYTCQVLGICIVDHPLFSFALREVKINLLKMGSQLFCLVKTLCF